MTVTRRQFLAGAGATAGAATVASATVLADDVGAEPVPSILVDDVVRTTCSPNCTGSCGQLAFVRDGRIVKIQQAADYPDTVYTPRGCMKGLSYHLQVYNPDRITTPLIRTGERGSGEFREATWEEALDHVAVRAEAHRRGVRVRLDPRLRAGAGLGLRPQGRELPGVGGPRHEPRHVLRLQRRPADGHAHHVRRAERRARGEGLGEREVPARRRREPTRDPDPRRALPVRRRGERRSHRGRRPRVQRHRVEGRHVDPAERPGPTPPSRSASRTSSCARACRTSTFLRTYTDAPLLVNERHRQAPARGRPPRGGLDRAVRRLGRPRPARRRPSASTGSACRRESQPALTGTFEVTLADGARVVARPGCDHVLSEVGSWTPEAASAVTGVSVDLIERLAIAYASTKPAAILMGGGSNHWYHGDLTGRAYALLAVMTGNVGEVRRRLQRVRGPVQGARRRRAVELPRRDPRADRLDDLLGHRPHRDDAPLRPVPGERLQGAVPDVQQLPAAVAEPQPGLRAPGRDGARRRRRPPDDGDGEMGRRRAAGDDLVREVGSHGHAAPPVPAAPAARDRPGR